MEPVRDCARQGVHVKGVHERVCARGRAGRGVHAGEAGGGGENGREQEVQALGRCQTKVAAPIS